MLFFKWVTMRSWAKNYRHLSVYWLVRLFVIAADLLPRKAALALGRVLGNLVFSLSPRNARLAIRNLRAVYRDKGGEEVRRLARQSFSELGKNGADALRLRSVRGIVECEGWERLSRALNKRKGVICVTGHLGCWELMPRYVASRGVRIYPVAGTVYDGRVDSLVRTLRERGGVRVIDRGSSPREAMRILRRGEILGILIDQGARRDGVIVDFLGRPTRFPRGPAFLSLKTGAPIVPAAILRREDGTHLIRVGEEISLSPAANTEKAVTLGTQACASALERYIRAEPTQWLWSYPRWEG